MNLANWYLNLLDIIIGSSALCTFTRYPVHHPTPRSREERADCVTLHWYRPFQKQLENRSKFNKIAVFGPKLNLVGCTLAALTLQPGGVRRKTGYVDLSTSRALTASEGPHKL